MTAKDLKNALLQEAVQGRLVPQIASEGNARDLLEEIRKEKLSHGLDFANAKSGKRKSKKETALAGSDPCDITEEEIPFDIPESWCWCRLGEICTKLVDGDHNPPAGLQEKTEYLMLSSRNINDDKLVDLDLVRYLSKEVFEKENERTKAEKGDIFFTSVGTLGRSCIFDGSINVSFQRSVSIIKTEIFNYYLKYCLDSGYVQNFVVKNATGTAQKGFYLNQLAELIIPLPPLSEQKRIVAAIEKFMPLIEEYGKKETQLKAINEKIGTLTKKAILQEAVQGKLVPQIASEGNARDLLEEIRKEKLSHGLDFANAKSGKRKSKKETALAGSNPCDITEEEIPFDIPENWCWCRLGEIVYNNGQKTPDKEFSYIDIGSIDNLHQKLNDKENFVLPEQAPSRARKIVKKGDIIYATVRPYLHNMCIIDKDFEKEPIASTGFAVLACYPQINNQYLFYYLLSPSFDSYANDTENSKGVAYPAINDDRLYKGIVPLPPLAEQKRIVAAIEKMLPLCEKLGE
ncbi:restriction endonuclease subunit S [uncultured Treponema sp.]|uniref:restriction endonuclease subunit S n=1 Tax=uncultured Treponema sp. TaxID=162155 RepID=UPI0025D47C72|nr:restriction endonuclease subunit S [uncultured Treponema sp.]